MQTPETCPKSDDPDFVAKIIKQVDDEAAELTMLRNLRDELGAAIANEGPHTIEHLMACSMLGKHTTVIGRKRYEQLKSAESERDELAAKLGEIEAWAKSEREHWREKNADRYWQMNRVVNQFPIHPTP